MAAVENSPSFRCDHVRMDVQIVMFCEIQAFKPIVRAPVAANLPTLLSVKELCFVTGARRVSTRAVTVEMESVPEGRIHVEPISRKYRLVFKRQRAKHALQLAELDRGADHVSRCERAVQVLSEARAKAADRQAAGLPALPLLNDLALIERRLAEATVALRSAEAEQKRHWQRQESLVMKQSRERARLVNVAGAEWKHAKSGALAAVAGAGAAASDGAAAVASGAEGGSAEGSAGASKPAVGAPVPPVAHTQLCAYCAAQIEKLKALSCSECHRDFCGIGGRSIFSEHAAPCCEIYRCACNQIICHECYVGSTSRSPSHWASCSECGSFMCHREIAGKHSGCKSCETFPLCKACRTGHDKTCKRKISRAEESTDASDSDS